MLCFKRVFSICLLAIGCTSVATAQETTATEQKSERIVSLNGSNTELLFALGVGDRVVGRDDSGVYPPEVNNLPSIGYQFQLNAEGILSLKPTLVIGRSDVRPPAVVDQIKAAGVNVELVDEPKNFDQAAARIKKLGQIVGKTEAAEKLVAGLQEDVKAFEKRKRELGDKTKKKAVFLYLRGPKTTFVLGEDTNPGSMLTMVGADNVMGSVGHTAPVTAEALIAAQPEVIVTFTHGLESIGGVEGLSKLQGVAQTPAGKNKRFVVMDDLYLGGFTNRAGKAALDLLNAIQADGVTVVEAKK